MPSDVSTETSRRWSHHAQPTWDSHPSLDSSPFQQGDNAVAGSSKNPKRRRSCWDMDELQRRGRPLATAPPFEEPIASNSTLTHGPASLQHFVSAPAIPTLSQIDVVLSSPGSSSSHQRPHQSPKRRSSRHKLPPLIIPPRDPCEHHHHSQTSFYRPAVTRSTSLDHLVERPSGVARELSSLSYKPSPTPDLSSDGHKDHFFAPLEQVPLLKSTGYGPHDSTLGLDALVNGGGGGNRRRGLTLGNMNRLPVSCSLNDLAPVACSTAYGRQLHGQARDVHLNLDLESDRDTATGALRVPRRVSSLQDRNKPLPLSPKDPSSVAATPGHIEPPTPPPKNSFVYVGGSDVTYTLQEAPTVGLGKPLVSPAATSLVKSTTTPNQNSQQDDFFTSKVLGSSPHASHGARYQIPEELAEFDRALKFSDSDQGHVPTDELVALEHGAPDQEHDQDRTLHLPSLTETSSGEGDGTAEIGLSSASTSLSRSTKHRAESETCAPATATTDSTYPATAAATTIDQVSKSLQEQLTKRIARADARRFQLVELVETEVAFATHLRDLVEVYLPQFAALSCVSELDYKMVARNLDEMVYFHDQFSARMVDGLKEEHLGTEIEIRTPIDETARTERMIRKISAIFVEDASGMKIYDEYCSGAAFAMDVLRPIEMRPEWHTFEKRCQIVVASRQHKTLHDLLQEDSPHFNPASAPPATLFANHSRLHFRDLLILPVQRICRYPLVLANLVPQDDPLPLETHIDLSRACDVGVHPSRALTVAKVAAAKADEANRRSMIASRTAHIARRLEPHPFVTKVLVSDLGPCLLGGALDVLYHHRQFEPLISPVKVRYLGAFLYKGFLLLVKVKKSSYEIRHYLPLEMFEMIDVTEGFLPFSIRLSFLDHHFELAASCQQEKDVWAAELCQAKEGLDVSPFDLPCSIPRRAPGYRRESALEPVDSSLPTASPISKRNSLGSYDTSAAREPVAVSMLVDSPQQELEQEPCASPTSATFTRRGSSLHAATAAAASTAPMSLLLKRVSPWHRGTIDAHIIFSEEVSLAKVSAEQKAAPLPPAAASTGAGSGAPPTSTRRNRLSMREASVLNRRRSYADVRGAPPPSSSSSTHARNVSVNSVGSKEENRLSLTRVSSKRSSFAGSIKRGLSISLGDGSEDLWDASVPSSAARMFGSPEHMTRPLGMPRSPVVSRGGGGGGGAGGLHREHSDEQLQEEPCEVMMVEEEEEEEAEDEPSVRRHKGRHPFRSHSHSKSTSSLAAASAASSSRSPVIEKKKSIGALFTKSKHNHDSRSLPVSPARGNIVLEPDVCHQGRSLESPYYSQAASEPDSSPTTTVYKLGTGLTNTRPMTTFGNLSAHNLLSRSLSMAKAKATKFHYASSSDGGGGDSRRASIVEMPTSSSCASSITTCGGGGGGAGGGYSMHENHRELHSVPGSPTEPTTRPLSSTSQPRHPSRTAFGSSSHHPFDDDDDDDHSHPSHSHSDHHMTPSRKNSHVSDTPSSLTTSSDFGPTTASASSMSSQSTTSRTTLFSSSQRRRARFMNSIKGFTSITGQSS